MTEYAWGVLTPFLALAGLAVAVGAAWLLIALARLLWAKVHGAMLETVDVRRNKAQPYKFKGQDGAPPKREYEDAANIFRDALLESPRFHLLRGLGWMLVLVRDFKETGSSASDDDERVDVEEVI